MTHSRVEGEPQNRMSTWRSGGTHSQAAAGWWGVECGLVVQVCCRLVYLVASYIGTVGLVPHSVPAGGLAARESDLLLQWCNVLTVYAADGWAEGGLRPGALTDMKLLNQTFGMSL